MQVNTQDLKKFSVTQDKLSADAVKLVIERRFINWQVPPTPPMGTTSNAVKCLPGEVLTGGGF